MKNVEVVDLKLHSNKGVSLLIQVILVVLVLVFGVIQFFIPELITVLYFLLALTMFVMAYNNVKFFHKKYLTYIYIIVGIFVLVTTILELL